MPLRAEDEIAKNMERAMARVNVLQRTLANSERRTSKLHSLFSSGCTSRSDSPTAREYFTSLGKFNTVNATFKWPNLEPSSGRQKAPVLYMTEHRSRELNTRINIAPPGDSSSDEHDSPSASPSPSPSGLKRCRSIGVDPEIPLVEPLRKVYLVPGYSYEVAHHRSYIGEQAEPETEETVRYPSLADDLRKPRDHCPEREFPRCQIFSTIKPFPVQPIPAAVSQSNGDENEPDPNEWKKYAACELNSVDSKKIHWKCKWIMENGAECYYGAKKQLLKRHIETVHLAVKRFRCTYCTLRYAQKTSLEIHMSAAHTGKVLKECPYEGCTMTFRDPARLHRHKIDTHGYVPRPTARKKKPVKCI